MPGQKYVLARHSGVTAPSDPSLDATFVSSFDPSHNNVGDLVGSSVDVGRAESEEFARHASVLWTALVRGPTNSSAISKSEVKHWHAKQKASPLLIKPSMMVCRPGLPALLGCSTEVSSRTLFPAPTGK